MKVTKHEKQGGFYALPIIVITGDGRVPSRATVYPFPKGGGRDVWCVDTSPQEYEQQCYKPTHYRFQSKHTALSFAKRFVCPQLDNHAITELKLYSENNEYIYTQHIIPIVKNIQKKMVSGKYDHVKAPKLWIHMVNESARKYVLEFGGSATSAFPKREREAVAKLLADEYREEIEAQGGEMFPQNS